MSRSKDKASVVNHGDHEVIVPENKLRAAVSTSSPEDEGEDAIERAEKALAALSPEFGAWMDSECERLDGARHDILRGGFTDANKEALFRAAHDIKGQAATFGYPAVASAAESLCRLIEHAPDPDRIPSALIDQHVDAVRAITTRNTHGDSEANSVKLAEKLRQVTDEFLAYENRDRPDYLESILAPTIAPG